MTEKSTDSLPLVLFGLVIVGVLAGLAASVMLPSQGSAASYGAADNGKTISIGEGKTFKIILDENPSTGYSWNSTLTSGLEIVASTYIQGGSPGHCVIVVDLCEKPATGEKAFLLAQSYMPAQQIHVLKNPARDEPWYYRSELSYPFATPQWTFEEGSHRRLPG
jgi:hypothetical protein